MPSSAGIVARVSARRGLTTIGLLMDERFAKAIGGRLLTWQPATGETRPLSSAFAKAAARQATVLDAQPDVLNHNTETIARLYRRVRPDAVYQQSLTLLQRAATRRDRENRGMLTKSGIMVGLGETFDEVVELMRDLRSVSCDIMTIGQYLQPHARRLPVERYVTPEEFAKWREIGMSLGFHHVESSPLTRSSYHAREQAAK